MCTCISPAKCHVCAQISIWKLKCLDAGPPLNVEFWREAPWTSFCLRCLGLSGVTADFQTTEIWTLGGGGGGCTGGEGSMALYPTKTPPLFNPTLPTLPPQISRNFPASSWQPYICLNMLLVSISEESGWSQVGTEYWTWWMFSGIQQANRRLCTKIRRSSKALILTWIPTYSSFKMVCILNQYLYWKGVWL